MTYLEKFKGILIDIDNTVYPYDVTHKIALEKVGDFFETNFSIEKKQGMFLYEKARKLVKSELNNASSHNRLLYFQKMLELCEINSLKYALDINNLYCGTYLENMHFFPGFHEFLDLIKDKKICIVTDLIADFQFSKVKKLGLDKYINNIVTSEETGFDKPHPYMFLKAMRKIDLTPQEVCFIGDDFNKDILGALNLNIQPFWFNHENEIKQDINGLIEFKSYNELMEIFCGTHEYIY